MRKVGVLYVTFARDLPWIEPSMQSFIRYATGFSGVTIVVPAWDVDKFLYLEAKYSRPGCPVLIKNFLEYPGKGFVHHLAMKCYADVFMPDMDFVLHMDPDCMWHEPVTPDDYFVDDKPVLLIEPYEALKAHRQNERYHWKSVTEMALRFDCPYETMCRHPAVHPKRTYRLTRDHIEQQHLTPFTDFVIKQQNAFPQGFGEFNTLGAFAYKHLHFTYHWIDRGYDKEAKDPHPKLVQMWSGHSLPSDPQNAERIRKILS